MDLESLTCGLSDGNIIQFCPKRFNKKVKISWLRDWHKINNTKFENFHISQASTKAK